MVTQPTPQPDSPDISECQFSELDKILNTYYMDRQKNPYKAHQDATAKLGEYYTNKFLSIVGKDEFVDSLEGYNVPSWDDMRKQAASLGKNKLRAELRTEIKQLSKEP